MNYRIGFDEKHHNFRPRAESSRFGNSSGSEVAWRNVDLKYCNCQTRNMYGT